MDDPTPEWLRSVARVLPLPYRAPLPYTLGEAVSELGAYAAALDDTRWGQDQAKKNCKSLQSEIEFQQSRLGARLSRVVAPIADELIGTKGRSRFIADAARFDAIWRSSPAISAAFEDVCDAAQRAGTTTRQLR